MFLFAYLMLLIINFNVVVTALYDQWVQGGYVQYIVIAIFQFEAAMVIWSHISCMTTDPGYLKQNLKKIQKERLQSKELVEYIIVQKLLEQRKKEREKNNESSSMQRESEQDDLELPLLQEYKEADEGLDRYTKEKLKAKYLNYCYICESPKPPRAHHCRVCGRCIIKMDHHCPWMNNCIGLQNMKIFMVLLAYSFILTMTSLIIYAIFLSKCVREECKVFDDLPGIVFIFVIGGIISLTFAAFTIIMFISMISVIRNDTTTIDILKKECIDARKSPAECMREVFGGKFSIHWFLPTKPQFDLSLEKQYE
ncbi:unnamed protein product [Moneuplotes crassus]|uniref:Palmitoyltransferase n=1 Tax=Euplotes crassus TaxID=5936 RepID=A0AAD1XNW4_EUPCR|nr:unnamed protein product [Moneuplotes crassus]